MKNNLLLIRFIAATFLIPARANEGPQKLETLTTTKQRVYKNVEIHVGGLTGPSLK